MMCSRAPGSLSLIQEMSRNTPAVRTPPPFAHLAQDAAGDVVAGQQLGRTARVLVALGVAPPLLVGVGGLAPVVLRDVVEHEAAAVAVPEHAALAPHALRHQDAPHARRPDHAGGMELDELHVLQRGAGVVGERVPVAGVLPAVAGDRVGPADSPGRQHDRLAAVQPEPPALAVVPQRAGHPAAVGEDPEHRALHVHVDALVDAVVLQRADHLQPGAVAHVRQAGILVPAEVALEDAAVGGAVEQRAPRLQLPHPVRRLPRVQLGHPPVVDVLPAAHRVGEVHLPAVAVVHVAQRGRHAALGHHGVRLAQERLADQADLHARRGRGDRRPQPRAAGADDQDVVLERLVVSHGRRSLVTLSEAKGP